MKLRYDASHEPWQPETGDLVMLRLRHYRVPGVPNQKFSEQRIGPFPVERMVGRLACKIRLPSNWSKIHPVISITELEPVPRSVDQFKRERKPSDKAVLNRDPTPGRLLAHRQRHVGRNRAQINEYRVRWKDLGPANDCWVRETDLPPTIVREFNRQATAKL